MSKEKIRKLSIILVAAVFCLGLSGFAVARDTARQTVTYEVTAIDELSVSGGLVLILTINLATAGEQPTCVRGSMPFAITTNCADKSKKITAVLDSNMPTGMTLSAHLEEGSGIHELSETPVNLSTEIGPQVHGALNLDALLCVTVDAGVVQSAQRTITLTFTGM